MYILKKLWQKNEHKNIGFKMKIYMQIISWSTVLPSSIVKHMQILVNFKTWASINVAQFIYDAGI